MEDEMSNDVEAIEYVDSQDEDDSDGGEKRPIMLLLRRLIKNKQNTVMTNAQIIDILQSEFNISINTSHELEVDIYIKIIKKYLKDWPQWEELERISTKLNKLKDYDAISKVLDHKYKNLKEYLGVMLEATKPLAKEAVNNLKLPAPAKTDDNLVTSDVVMEIQCTRDQLNHLFLRRPRVDLNNSLFNVAPVEPSRISLQQLSFDNIINWWCIKITINFPFFKFVREVMHKLSHTLVNKARKEQLKQDILLDTNLFVKPIKRSKNFEKRQVLLLISNIRKEYVAENFDLYETVCAILDIIIAMLDNAPDHLEIPGNYKRYANSCKYVRYLYAENEHNNDPTYDLQLEEIISPMYYYYIGKFGPLVTPLPPLEEWLKVECMVCKYKIAVTTNFKYELQSHFNNQHQNERDWQCMRCNKSFTMEALAKSLWKHEC